MATMIDDHNSDKTKTFFAEKKEQVNSMIFGTPKQSQV